MNGLWRFSSLALGYTTECCAPDKGSEPADPTAAAIEGSGQTPLVLHAQFAAKYEREADTEEEAARREAVFHQNVQYCAAENAKGTNTCDVLPAISHTGENRMHTPAKRFCIP